MSAIFSDLEKEKQALNELENALKVATEPLPTYLEPSEGIKGILSDVTLLLNNQDITASQKKRIETLKNQISERRQLIETLEKKAEKEQAKTRIEARLPEVEATIKEYHAKIVEVSELLKKLKQLSLENDIDRRLAEIPGQTIEGVNDARIGQFCVFQNGKGYMRDKNALRAAERALIQ